MHPTFLYISYFSFTVHLRVRITSLLTYIFHLTFTQLTFHHFTYCFWSATLLHETFTSDVCFLHICHFLVLLTGLCPYYTLSTSYTLCVHLCILCKCFTLFVHLTLFDNVTTCYTVSCHIVLHASAVAVFHSAFTCYISTGYILFMVQF